MVITGQLGCNKGTSLCYSEGGTDVTIAEKICAYNCNITLPRTEGGKYYGFLDNCGGHTKDYHYHKELGCLYTTAANSKHSIRVAEVKASSSVGGSGGAGKGGGSGGGGSSGAPTCSDNSTPKCPDGSALEKSHPPCTQGNQFVMMVLKLRSQVEDVAEDWQVDKVYMVNGKIFQIP